MDTSAPNNSELLGFGEYNSCMKLKLLLSLLYWKICTFPSKHWFVLSLLPLVWLLDCNWQLYLYQGTPTTTYGWSMETLRPNRSEEPSDGLYCSNLLMVYPWCNGMYQQSNKPNQHGFKFAHGRLPWVIMLEWKILAVLQFQQNQTTRNFGKLQLFVAKFETLGIDTNRKNT